MKVIHLYSTFQDKITRCFTKKYIYNQLPKNGNLITWISYTDKVSKNTLHNKELIQMFCTINYSLNILKSQTYCMWQPYVGRLFQSLSATDALIQDPGVKLVMLMQCYSTIWMSFQLSFITLLVWTYASSKHAYDYYGNGTLRQPFSPSLSMVLKYSNTLYVFLSMVLKHSVAWSVPASTHPWRVFEECVHIF